MTALMGDSDRNDYANKTPETNSRPALRSTGGGNSDAPFTLNLAFPAAVAQLYVIRRRPAYRTFRQRRGRRRCMCRGASKTRLKQTKRSKTMGDKGGKKDKSKEQKQKQTKKEQDTKKKQGKQPKRAP